MSSKLLLSARGLVRHLVSNIISHSWYILLDALVTSLSALTSFKDLVNSNLNPPDLDLAGYDITANVHGPLGGSFSVFIQECKRVLLR
jgi:hypothetical protein